MGNLKILEKKIALNKSKLSIRQFIFLVTSLRNIQVIKILCHNNFLHINVLI